MFKAKITVGLKKGVSDPEGANTLKALKLLGFENIIEAKTTRTYELLIDGKDIDSVKKDVKQMCQRLLTNPVIHSYKISVDKK